MQREQLTFCRFVREWYCFIGRQGASGFLFGLSSLCGKASCSQLGYTVLFYLSLPKNSFSCSSSFTLFYLIYYEYAKKCFELINITAFYFKKICRNYGRIGLFSVYVLTIYMQRAKRAPKSRRDAFCCFHIHYSLFYYYYYLI